MYLHGASWRHKLSPVCAGGLLSVSVQSRCSLKLLGWQCHPRFVSGVAVCHPCPYGGAATVPTDAGDATPPGVLFTFERGTPTHQADTYCGTPEHACLWLDTAMDRQKTWPCAIFGVACEHLGWHALSHTRAHPKPSGASTGAPSVTRVIPRHAA